MNLACCRLSCTDEQKNCHSLVPALQKTITHTSVHTPASGRGPVKGGGRCSGERGWKED